jgi:hypothetical protein
MLGHQQFAEFYSPRRMGVDDSANIVLEADQDEFVGGEDCKSVRFGRRLGESGRVDGSMRLSGTRSVSEVADVS